MTTLAQPQPPTPAADRRGRRWLIVGATAWGLLLVGVAVLSYHRDEPTVREQRTIAEAAPVVDGATGDLAAAVLGSPATLVISGREVTPGCRLTSAWDGATLERAVTVRTTDSAAPGVLDEVAGRLPARYGARVRHDQVRGLHRFRADAGEFVALTGSVSAPGVITFTVRTGCRPPSPDFDPREGERPNDVSVASATVNLRGLRATEITVVDTAVVWCQGRKGRYISQTATGRGVLGRRLSDIAGRAGVEVLTDTPALAALRHEAGTVEVRVEDGRLVSTSTEIEGECPAGQ